MSSPAKPIRLRFLCVSSLLSAAVAYGVAAMMVPADNFLAQKLAEIFAIAGPSVNINTPDILARFVQFIALSAIAFAGHCIGFKLKSTARTVGFLQIFVAAIICQWFLLTFKLPVSPLSFVFVILLSSGVGRLFALYEHFEKRREAQFYELLLANKELQEARLQMAKQDEVDRRLLAADLHDQVLNDLKMVAEKARSLKANPREDTSKEIERHLQQAMASIREVMESLSPSVLQHLGFVQAIEDCLRQDAERGKFRLRFKSDSHCEVLSKMSAVEQILLYRLVQECGNNICKHAGAKLVKATIEQIADTTELPAKGLSFCLRIEDDGVGIRSQNASGDSRGLQYMKQRAQMIGANIAWLGGADGKGTVVEIRWSPDLS